ncbi:MAG TPA: MFS transporter, partial [Pseudonocardiaceae bacterium]
MSGRAPNWLVPLLVLIIGTFVSVLDVSIVNVAIPDIQKEFGTSVEDIQWISTAYSLTLGVLVPASGWLADRFGLRRVYIISLVGFAVTSAL